MRKRLVDPRGYKEKTVSEDDVIYEYGFYSCGLRIIIGSVTQEQYESKIKEINYANKINPGSRWFINLANTRD